MRYRELITERWFNTYDVQGHQIDVFINPTKSEFLRLITELTKKHGVDGYLLRAFVTPTDLYVWDAYIATHGDMEKHNIPQSGGYLYLSKEGILFNDLGMEYGDDPDKPYGPWLRRYYTATVNNPSILRIYGPNPKITGVDDEGGAGVKGYFPITPEFIEKYVESEQITESQQSTILITDLYSERDLSDESELISQYAPPIDWDIPLTIHMMPAEQVKSLLDARGRSILQSFRNATKDQRELVKYKIDNFDDERIVVLCDDTVIDGNHHVIAAIRANKPLRFVDLSEWD